MVQVAVPFMKEPFQCPLSERLNVSPKGISDAYKQFVQGLSGNYLQLLRTALQWTLFAPSPVRVVEIMDAFTGIYRLSGQNSQGIDAVEKTETYAVRTADRLEEVQQLRTAGGPFLDIGDEESGGSRWPTLRRPVNSASIIISQVTITKTLKSAMAQSASNATSPSSARMLSCSRRKSYILKWPLLRSDI
jgi:hypothetical protein